MIPVLEVFLGFALGFVLMALVLIRPHPKRWLKQRASEKRRAQVRAAGEAARLAILDRNAHRAEARRRARQDWDEQVMRAKGIQPKVVQQPRPLPDPSWRSPDVYRVHPTQGWKHEPIAREPIWVKASIWEAMTPSQRRRYVERALGIWR